MNIFLASVLTPPVDLPIFIDVIMTFPDFQIGNFVFGVNLPPDPSHCLFPLSSNSVSTPPLSLHRHCLTLGHLLTPPSLAIHKSPKVPGPLISSFFHLSRTTFRLKTYGEGKINLRTTEEHPHKDFTSWPQFAFLFSPFASFLFVKLPAFL